MQTPDIILLISFIAITSVVFMVGVMILRAQASSPQRKLTGAKTPEELVQALAFTMNLEVVNRDDDELAKDLRRAGYYYPSARRDLLLLRMFLVAVSLLTAGLMAVVIGPQFPFVVMVIFVAGILLSLVGWSMPRIVVSIQGYSRVHRIGKSLPDALDLISMCLMGGQNLEEALRHVYREMAMVHPDLATEMVIVRHQSSMKDVDFAFAQLALRIDCPEIIGLHTLIEQDRRLGSNIGQSFRDYSDSLRDQQRFEAEAKSNRAVVWLLLPITLCLLPATFLILWTPAIVELVNYMTTFQVPPVN